MKRIRKLLRRHLGHIVFIFGAVAIVASALLFRLSSLAPSLSPGEQMTLAATISLHKIIDNPAHLPLKLLEWSTRFAPTHHVLLFSRLPSVVLASISLLIFAYILRRWYGPRTAVFGFVMLATSAWFLHVGRFAGTDVEYLTGILALLAIHIGLYDHDDHPLMLYVWLLTNLALLFIPGFVWFVLLSLVWQRAELLTAWQKLGPLRNRIIWTVAAVVGLVATTYSITRNIQLLKVWLGAPEVFASWQSILRQLVNTLETVVYQGPHNPEIWLGRLPLLDTFSGIMLIAGIAFYIRHWRASRTRLLLSYLVLGIVLASLGGAVRFSVIVPIIYLVAIGGVAYILHFWLSTFPRNPLARATGIGIVVTIIALSCFYNLEQYFVAWPHNEEVVKIYQHPSP